MDEQERGPLNLIFDADDTLWDSNVHFLEAEQAFIAAIRQAGIAAEAAAIGDLIRQCELEVIRTHGYGRRPYVRALHRALEALVAVEACELMRAEIERIGEHLVGRHCELRPGVESTLQELAERHRLLLFTKGQPSEQLEKLERSGLAPMFSRVEVAAEKDTAAYHRLIESAGLEPARTFMIGNSPRSDINPALRAGLRAVYIPHPHTWVLELESVDLTDDR
ncbi:MAG TPA: HAD family hydrolase, partial [Candidatus Binataceae bacterium]|nr:HAD family hydrolase [Candidatus Binataceae bacterium]